MLIRLVSTSPTALAPASLTPDTYLTDGRRLFRVVSQLDPYAAHPLAVLEDCHSLSVDPYSADELYGMGLWMVSSDGSS